MTPLQVVFTWTVLAVGSSVQGSVGFGLGLIAAPMLVLIDPSLVPGPLLANALLLSIMLSLREHQAMDFGGLPWALGGRVVGIGLASLLLLALPGQDIGYAVGGVVLFAVLLSVSGLRIEPGSRSLVAAGTISGLTGTISSIGAPPIALLYQDASGARLRATLAGYFLVGIVMSLVALSLIGRFGGAEVRWAAVMSPGIVVGFLVSGRLAPLIDRGYTRRAVLAVSAAGGVVAIGKSLVG